MLAARKDIQDIVEILINAGADVEAKDKYGNTTLMLASSFNTPEVVNIFLKAGANVNVKSNNGMTPLINAAKTNRNPKVIDLLSENSNSKTGL